MSPVDRTRIYQVPTDAADLARLYGFSLEDLAMINTHRGEANRLGFAVQLAYMRYPGISLPVGEPPASQVLGVVADQLELSPTSWADYGDRKTTRREHRVELQNRFGYRTFTAQDRGESVILLTDVALRTDTAALLVDSFVDQVRSAGVLLPPAGVVELVCGEAITRANRLIREAIAEALADKHRARLDDLLESRPEGAMTWLSWLRAPPGKPNSAQILKHIDRLEKLREVGLPEGIERLIHQNRLLKIAREGAQMPARDIRRLEPLHRHTMLVALVVESIATIIDEIVDMHDRVITRSLAAAKHRHRENFHGSGKAINDKVRLLAAVGDALVAARRDGTDPFAAIEEFIPWEQFTVSVTEAADLARPASFDFLEHLGDRYATIHRYATKFCAVLDLKASPAAADLLEAVTVLRQVQEQGLRSIPEDAPTGFITARWARVVMTANGIYRRFYELCVMTELKNSLRAGDMSVAGSRQFKDFDDYLLPPVTFAKYKATNRLGIAINPNCEEYLEERLGLLQDELGMVDQAAGNGDLPGVVIGSAGLTISPQTTIVPADAQTLTDQVQALMPHVKITDLLSEVDQWTSFSRRFTNLKTGVDTKDTNLLLTAILADGINLGLTKMAESCPGTTYAKLARLQAWHIRDDTYRSALAEIVNAQHQQPFADNWGDGTTAASDGQQFRAGSQAKASGHINLKYGAAPGRMLYTHISDRYAPFHSMLINVGVRESTYVLDGLLYHEADLKIAEHYTDTNGFTDHVFALTHLLGYRFVPRIRDLGDTRLHTPSRHQHPNLAAITGTPLNLQQIRLHWDDITRLASSIKHGTVTASLMLRKLGSYPRQNGLAVGLREFGRIERTLMNLDWLQDTGMRQRATAGLNKGESRQGLARAVFFHRLGEIRDRSFEHQHHRASGLNLLTAAIILWNTVYLEQAVNHLQSHNDVDPDLLQHLSPLGWSHINLTGDYTWPRHRNTENLRPLYRPSNP